MPWNSIPLQLAKENKKFVYGIIREGARAKDYEIAIMWLSDCGLIHKISRVNAIGIPLKVFENLKAKSLKVYKENFSPKLSIRSSMADYKKEDWLVNLPLYAIEQIMKVIGD